MSASGDQNLDPAAWSGPGGRVREAGSRMAEFISSIPPVALAICLSLSLVTALAVPFVKWLAGAGTSWVSGVVTYALGTGVLAILVHRTRRFPEHTVVLALIAFSAVIKLGVAVWSMCLPLLADQELFHMFVRTMADTRLDPGAMRELSRIYDYPVWAGRVLPFHYVVRLLAGTRDLLWVRLFNVGLSTAILGVTYGLSRRLLPAGSRKWAVFLLVALPFQTMVVSDYSHHLFSSFYFLAGLWCVWEMVYSSASVRQNLILSLGATVFLLLMMWQRGTHLIALAVWLFLWGWMWLAGADWRRWGKAGLFAILIPVLASTLLARGYDDWLDRHDEHRLNSILPAFMARGWCPESKGEYCGRYEQLDRVTPWPDKSAAMFRLVASQVRSNPKVVCTRFPLSKTAKLFLVGYASNLEESLAAVKSRRLPFVRGMRWTAAPVFLAMAFWGCLVLARSPNRQGRWLPVVLAPLVTWGAYVFFGETSPRYSIFCQPFLALLGGLACAALPRGDLGNGDGPISWKAVSARAELVVGLIAGVFLLLTAVIRMLPAHLFYGNLEQGWELSQGTHIRPGAYRPFEAVLEVEAGRMEGEAEWSVLESPAVTDGLSFYLLDVSPEAGDMVLDVWAGGEIYSSVPLGSLADPRQVKVEGPMKIDQLRFVLRSIQPLAHPVRVAIGYVWAEIGTGEE